MAKVVVHPNILGLSVEMEMGHGEPTGRSILVVQTDAIIDHTSPEYDEALITDIRQAAREEWIRRKNPPEDIVRLIKRSARAKKS